ncbi:MAG TPA: isochorismatase family protein [Lacipirellula sp.]
MRAVDTALLVVDMQERLLAVIPGAERIQWNCRRLIDGAGILGMGVSITEQNPEKLGATAAGLGRRGDLAPLAKMAFSCGACGELHPRWQAAGVERVLLCGIESHVCVQQTAFDLLSAGYRVYVAADAVASRNADDYTWALQRMLASGAVVTTTEAALFELCERAGTPEFRQISALAKELPPGGDSSTVGGLTRRRDGAG